LNGRPIDKIPDLYSTMFEAMIALKAKVDLPSAIVVSELAQPIYSNRKIYPLPADCANDAIVAVRPIIPNTQGIYDFERRTSRQYDLETAYDSSITDIHAVRHKDGEQYLALAEGTTEPLVIHDCESVSENGTWTGVGGLTDIELEKRYIKAGSNALRFTINPNAGVNGIENISLEAQNLSTYKNVLLYLYIPNTILDADLFTGIDIRIGTDANNYFSFTVTQDFFGNNLQKGRYNLLSVVLETPTTTIGTPSLSNTQYVAVLANIDSAVTERKWFILDSIQADTGSIYEVEYYSNLQFLDTSTNTRLRMPTKDADSVVLNDEEFNLYKMVLVDILATDLRQASAGVDIQQYGGEMLQNAINEFTFLYPSKRQVKVTEYGHYRSKDIY